MRPGNAVCAGSQIKLALATHLDHVSEIRVPLEDVLDLLGAEVPVVQVDQGGDGNLSGEGEGDKFLRLSQAKRARRDFPTFERNKFSFKDGTCH